MRVGWGVLFSAAALLLAACTVPIVGGLDEQDADRVLVALDRVAIDAAKEADPTQEGKFRVTVPRDDAPRALETLRAEELPRPHTAGVFDTLEKGALVPSAAEEHAGLVLGMAGDLARTLEGIDGVLSARVHLNVPEPDPLRMGPAPRTTASVLVEHKGATPPIPDAAVARLVAFGVPNLAPADVAVVMVSRPAPPDIGEAPLRHVGPIAVARSSLRMLQAALVGMFILVAGFAAATLALYARIRRQQATQTAADGSR